MVLELEFWSPPFRFSTNASANLLVFVAKLGVTPQTANQLVGGLQEPLGEPSELP